MINRLFRLLLWSLTIPFSFIEIIFFGIRWIITGKKMPVRPLCFDVKI